MNQPRKRGKKHALKQARKLEKNPEEIRNELKQDTNSSRVYVAPKDLFGEAVEELWEKWSRLENYPFFSRLEPQDLQKLVVWARQEISIK